jgi:hypothetical protein
MTVKDRLRASKSNRTNMVNIPQQKVTQNIPNTPVPSSNSSDSINHEILKIFMDSTAQLNNNISKIENNTNGERLEKIENQINIILMQLNNEDIIRNVVFALIDEDKDEEPEVSPWKEELNSMNNVIENQKLELKELATTIKNMEESFMHKINETENKTTSFNTIIQELQNEIKQTNAYIEKLKEETSRSILKFADEMYSHNSEINLKINKNQEEITQYEQKIKSFSKKVKTDITQLETKLKTDVSNTIEKNENMVKESNKDITNKLSNAITRSKNSIELKFNESQQMIKLNIENEKSIFKNKLDEIERKVKKSKDVLDKVSKTKFEEQANTLIENYILELSKLNVICETNKMMQRDNNYMKQISSIIYRLNKLEKNIQITA